MARVILFDFFGTLLEAPADLSAVRFPEAYQYLRSLGVELTYEEYFARWSATSERFENRARKDHVEYSMAALGAEFFTECLSMEPAGGVLDTYLEIFLSEWDAALEDIGGVPDAIEALASSYRLGIVSNTNDPALVPARLERLGIEGHFSIVSLSIHHGRRKPHPSIYEDALEELGASPREALFVGDSFDADYLGPRALGIDSWLIDPNTAHDIDPSRRLLAVTELPTRLGAR